MKTELVDVDEIEEIIFAFANGELHRRLAISDLRGDRDTIVAGINMLGEELQSTTISRDYFSNIYNAVSEILIIIDLEGKITDVNLSAEQTLKRSKDNLKNINVSTLISGRFNSIENKIKNRLNNGENFVSFEAALLNGSETEVPVSCSISKIIDRFKNHKGYLFTAKDITEKKNKELNDRKIIIATQEKERKRLSYDLHDSLGQELNAVKMYINSLAVMDASSEEYKEAFETCKNIVDISLETIRNISFDLMPKALEQGGLIHALNELANRLDKVCDIEYNFPKIKLDMDKENQIIIYRIVQEFINNSLKYSPNSKIKFNLSRKKKMLNLSIEDNGKGFNFETVKYGNGIFNMKTRLEALNAKYDFGSIINKGTYLKLSI